MFVQGSTAKRTAELLASQPTSKTALPCLQRHPLLRSARMPTSTVQNSSCMKNCSLYGTAAAVEHSGISEMSALDRGLTATYCTLCMTELDRSASGMAQSKSKRQARNLCRHAPRVPRSLSWQGLHKQTVLQHLKPDKVYWRQIWIGCLTRVTNISTHPEGVS